MPFLPESKNPFPIEILCVHKGEMQPTLWKKHQMLGRKMGQNFERCHDHHRNHLIHHHGSWWQLVIIRARAIWTLTLAIYHFDTHRSCHKKAAAPWRQKPLLMPLILHQRLLVQRLYVFVVSACHFRWLLHCILTKFVARDSNTPRLPPRISAHLPTF
jgi:hypothetical protein